MRIFKWIRLIPLAFSFFATQTLAQPIVGESNTNASLSSVIKLVPLVDRTRTISVCDGSDCTDRESRLRVSVIQINNGPSTDVTPPYTIYLAMHNTVEEHAVASSLHRIAISYDLVDAKRIEAGIYSLSYRGLHSEHPQCLDAKILTRIDARALSVAVRQAKRTKFFVDATYTNPVDIFSRLVDCSITANIENETVTTERISAPIIKQNKKDDGIILGSWLRSDGAIKLSQEVGRRFNVAMRSGLRTTIEIRHPNDETVEFWHAGAGLFLAALCEYKISQNLEINNCQGNDGASYQGVYYRK